MHASPTPKVVGDIFIKYLNSILNKFSGLLVWHFRISLVVPRQTVLQAGLARVLLLTGGGHDSIRDILVELLL